MTTHSTPEGPPWVDPKYFVYPGDIPIPNVDHLTVEDGVPVESMYFEKLMRLLTEPLYASWPGPAPGVPFLALANVGLFAIPKDPALAPDVMLSVGVQAAADLHRRENRSYMLWEFGKPPDVVIEFVSDRRGGEEHYKAEEYARMGAPYYVIFDPELKLKHGILRSFEKRANVYVPQERPWFPGVNLGVTLWTGTFEGHSDIWLRWCDQDGQLIPTGIEGREAERQRAEQEKQRAEQERQRAEQEKQRADEERQHRERLQAHLRSLGIDPSSIP